MGIIGKIACTSRGALANLVRTETFLRTFLEEQKELHNTSQHKSTGINGANNNSSTSVCRTLGHANLLKLDDAKTLPRIRSVPPP